jgi:organic hydroperoxide reductase OsmC/OhrA
MNHKDAEISILCRKIHLFRLFQGERVEHIAKLCDTWSIFVIIQDELNMAYTVKVKWEKAVGDAFSDNKYSREHKWIFDGGVEVPASASPHVVPLPYSSEAAVDPEEAFAASLSSCHMLWFLSIAAERNLVVESYEDIAEGVMGKNDEGRIAMTKVTLRPKAKFGGNIVPTAAEIGSIHHEAHDKCFIANSVKTIVVIEPVSYT